MLDSDTAYVPLVSGEKIRAPATREEYDARRAARLKREGLPEDLPCVLDSEFFGGMLYEDPDTGDMFMRGPVPGEPGYEEPSGSS